MDIPITRDCLPTKDPLTLSHYVGKCQEPLDDRTMVDLVEAASRTVPDRVMYRVPEYNQQLTSLDVKKQSDSVAKALMSVGVARGDIVMCVGVATTDLFPIMFGTYTVGGIYFGPFLFKPKSKNLSDYIKRLKPKLLICGLSTSDNKNILNDLTGSEVLTNQLMVSYGSIAETKSTQYGNTVLTYDAFIKQGEGVRETELTIRKSSVQQTDTALIISSTGSSGVPKLSCLTHLTLVNFAKLAHIRKNPLMKSEVEAFLGPNSDDVSPTMQSLSPLEFPHLTGVMLPSVVSYEEDGFDVLKKTIQDEKVTSLMAYPYFVLDLVNSVNTSYDLSSLRKGLLVAQMITKDVRSRTIKRFPEYLVGYGTTEFLCGTTTSYLHSSREEYLETVGYPFPHTEVKIVDDNGKTVPIYTTGEICLKGWSLMKCYHSSSCVAKSQVDDSGWFYTGDVGSMTSNGHVIMLGRKSDCIRYKKMGDIVYPSLIEGAAKEHEKIQDAAVVGVPDDKLGDLIHICIIPKPDCELAEEEVKLYLETKLIDRDRPDFVHFFKSLPTVGARNKVSRSLLTQALMNDKTWKP